MKNYLCIKGKKIELSEEQLEQIRAGLMKEQVRLGEKEVGESFSVGYYEFIVLEQTGEQTIVIMKGLLQDDVKFGEKNNDFRESNVLPILREFAKELEELVGADNLIEHEVDLTSDDGLKDYGITEEKVSLLTTDLYRKYVDTLDKDRLDAWWWLATPHSTKRHENDLWVKCVSPSGGISYDSYYSNYGVRPFCILKSDIFVS